MINAKPVLGRVSVYSTVSVPGPGGRIVLASLTSGASECATFAVQLRGFAEDLQVLVYPPSTPKTHLGHSVRYCIISYQVTRTLLRLPL